MKNCNNCSTSFNPQHPLQKYCSKSCSYDYHYAIRAKNRRPDILKKFGLDEQKYLSILESQNGLCAICGKLEETLSASGNKVKHLAVDHDHKTQVVRGLLCARCNKMLGLAKDSPYIFAEASIYLLKHGTISDVGLETLRDRLSTSENIL
jgi:hypothetical protein